MLLGWLFVMIFQGWDFCVWLDGKGIVVLFLLEDEMFDVLLVDVVQRWWYVVQEELVVFVLGVEGGWQVKVVMVVEEVLVIIVCFIVGVGDVLDYFELGVWFDLVEQVEVFVLVVVIGLVDVYL